MQLPARPNKAARVGFSVTGSGCRKRLAVKTAAPPKTRVNRKTKNKTFLEDPGGLVDVGAGEASIVILTIKLPFLPWFCQAFFKSAPSGIESTVPIAPQEHGEEGREDH